jgi:hypothetical protein
MRFSRRGTLESSTANVRKKHKIAHHPKSSIFTKETKMEGCNLICFGESRRMCIVTCGHFGPCASCGDEGLFAGKERPYSAGPDQPGGDVREPYVMERWVWEELGGIAYDT